MAEHHEFFGGKVHVYKRPEGSFWQCSAYVNGRNHRVSTKERSLNLAKEFAEDWFLSLKGKLARGELKREKTFREAAEKFLYEYEVITEGQRSPDYVKAHETKVRVHLLPFFGDKPLSEITAGLVLDYRIHRHKDLQDWRATLGEHHAQGHCDPPPGA